MLLICDVDFTEGAPPPEVLPPMLPAFFAAQAAYRGQVAAVQDVLGVSESEAMAHFDPFSAAVVEGEQDLAPGGNVADLLGIEDGDVLAAVIDRMEYARQLPGGTFIEVLLSVSDVGGNLLYVPTYLLAGRLRDTLPCRPPDAEAGGTE